MDEDTRNLEAELSRLRPAALRGHFLLRVEGDLVARRRAVSRWLWAAMPAAAALAAASVFGIRWPARPAVSAAAARAVPAFRPVSVRDVLVSANDEGYVVLADGRAAHRLREAHLDTIVWKDPRSAASLRWSVPREEIRIVPVSFQ